MTMDAAGSTRIAVPIVQACPAIAAQVEHAARLGADLVELRADRIRDLEAVADYLGRPQTLPAIVTVRSKTEGGSWEGNEAQRREAILRLARLRPAFIDVELVTWESAPSFRSELSALLAPPPANTEAGAGPRLIISHHDLAGTPADLTSLISRLAATPAYAIKLVTTPADATDALRMLDMLKELGGLRPVIALGIGEAGLITRVLSRKLRAFLSFASIDDDRQSATGQPTIAALRERFRWGSLTESSALLGVIGWPTTHSRSPEVHNAAMAASGVDGVYLPLPVRPTAEAFEHFMDAVRARPWLNVRGFSVTLPHKEHALRWLLERGYRVSEAAHACGAVNTLTQDADGTWAGDNTDVDGFRDALLRAAPPAARLPGQRTAVLGAGGVARAVVIALRDLGCFITLFNRTADRAQRLAAELAVHAEPWEKRLAWRGEIIVNCTAVGLWPALHETPLPGYEGYHQGQVVVDTIYNPPQTRILQDAAKAGARIVGGSAMFIGQAREQYLLWHGAKMGKIQGFEAGTPTEI